MKSMVNIGIPSTGAIIGFVISALVIGVGVAFAPEIKSAIMGVKRKVVK